MSISSAFNGFPRVSQLYMDSGFETLQGWAYGNIGCIIMYTVLQVQDPTNAAVSGASEVTVRAWVNKASDCRPDIG